MSQPVYKLFLFNYTEAWYQLSPEEQQKHNEFIEQTLKQVGGERVVICVSLTEEWAVWGVEKFPSLEALEKQAALLYTQNHYRYVKSVTYLGIDYDQVQKLMEVIR